MNKRMSAAVRRARNVTAITDDAATSMVNACVPWKAQKRRTAS
jgi:hypothetical protein